MHIFQDFQNFNLIFLVFVLELKKVKNSIPIIDSLDVIYIRAY
jgi:hypothetical protein